MRTGRLLVGCLAVSLAVHLAAGAHYDFGSAAVQRAVSPGGTHTVAGDLADLVAGTRAPTPVDAETEAQVDPTETRKEMSRPDRIAPVRERTKTPVDPDRTARAVKSARAVPQDAEPAAVQEPVAELSPLVRDDAEPILHDPQEPNVKPLDTVEEIAPVRESVPDRERREARHTEREAAEVAPERVSAVEAEQVEVDAMTVPVPGAKPKVERTARRTEKKRQPTRRSKPVKRGNSERDQVRGQTRAASKAERGDGGRRARSNYFGRVNARIQRGMRYPRRARGAEGTVLVRFSIAPSGAVSGVRVVRSSGSRVLDEAAVSTVRRVAPFPAFPAQMRQGTQKVTVPIRYLVPR